MTDFRRQQMHRTLVQRSLVIVLIRQLGPDTFLLPIVATCEQISVRCANCSRLQQAAAFLFESKSKNQDNDCALGLSYMCLVCLWILDQQRWLTTLLHMEFGPHTFSGCLFVQRSWFTTLCSGQKNCSSVQAQARTGLVFQTNISMQIFIFSMECYSAEGYRNIYIYIPSTYV